MFKKIIYILFGFFMCILIQLIFSAIKFNNEYKKDQTINETQMLEEVKNTVDIIHNNYYLKDISKKELYKTAIKGIVNSLEDEYSKFLSYDELNKNISNLNGDYVGLGFEANKKKGKYLKILSVYKDSGAMKAGLISGDTIIEVDSIDIREMDSQEFSKYIKGEINSKVELKIKRNNNIFNISAIRTKVSSKVTSKRIINDSIGYVYISSFSMKLEEEFKNILNEFKDKGIKKLIIDLRYNTGGEILQVLPIASYLLNEENNYLFKVKYKNGYEKKYNRVSNQIFKGEIVVLVDKNTASAAEILTGILKDYNRATIVGEKTFAKGIIQGFYYLKSGDIIKITNSVYYTPKEYLINNVGIVPDIEKESSKSIQTAIDILQAN